MDFCLWIEDRGVNQSDALEWTVFQLIVIYWVWLNTKLVKLKLELWLKCLKSQKSLTRRLTKPDGAKPECQALLSNYQILPKDHQCEMWKYWALWFVEKSAPWPKLDCATNDQWQKFCKKQLNQVYFQQRSKRAGALESPFSWFQIWRTPKCWGLVEAAWNSKIPRNDCWSLTSNPDELICDLPVFIPSKPINDLVHIQIWSKCCQIKVIAVVVYSIHCNALHYVAMYA